MDIYIISISWLLWLVLSEHVGASVFYFFFFFFCLFAISWAVPRVYGGSQARGLIGAVAASLYQSTATQDPSRICDLHHSSEQRQVVNPLSKGRDWTRNLMVPSRIR